MNLTEQQQTEIEEKAFTLVSALLSCIQPEHVAESLENVADLIRKYPDTLKRIFQPETRQKLEAILVEMNGKKKVDIFDALGIGSKLYKILFK